MKYRGTQEIQMDNTVNTELFYYVENIQSFCSSVEIDNPTAENQTVSMSDIKMSKTIHVNKNKNLVDNKNLTTHSL